MVLPENLTTLASDSEANRQYHQEIHAAVPWLTLPTSIAAGQTTHLTHHDALHKAIDRGLLKGALDGVLGHGAQHNIVHGYINTTYQNELHVTKGGNDSNPGTWASPKLTIGAAITAALTANAAGQTSRIRVHATSPGTTTKYREQITIGSGGTTAAMVLEAAEDGVIVSGADDWTGGWTTHDAPNRIYYKTWTNNWGVSAYPAGWSGNVPTDPILRRREMAIINGVWVQQVDSLAAMTSVEASYFVDETADRLYIRIPTGGNIATIPVEVAIRNRCLEATSRTNLTLRGLTFQHAATEIDTAQVRLVSCTSPLVEDSTFKEASWGGFSTSGGSGFISRRNHYDSNGVMGYLGFQVTNQLYEDDTNSFNNLTRGAWTGYKNWADGCKILFCTGVTMRRCDQQGNNAPHFWFDTDGKNILLEDCRSWDGTSFSFFLESIQGPTTLRRFKATNNFRGINTTHARNLTIDDCESWLNNVEFGVGGSNASATVTEWDTSQTVSCAPGNWTIQNNLFWASTVAGEQAFNSAFTASDASWAGWTSTLTATTNAYHSTVNTTPYHTRTNTTAEILTNFAGWKTNLGGSRDSTSSFSSSAPSPAPTL